MNLARMLGLYPYSFSKDILGFLMTSESQDLGLSSPCLWSFHGDTLN